MIDKLWRIWRLALIWLSFRVPAGIEWLIVAYLYTSDRPMFSMPDLWQARLDLERMDRD